MTRQLSTLLSPLNSLATATEPFHVGRCHELIREGMLQVPLPHLPPPSGLQLLVNNARPILDAPLVFLSPPSLSFLFRCILTDPRARER